jgi:D-serine deaminase-like pyridoxal phosphate-dependent protein
MSISHLIEKPTLLLDKAKAITNIEKMIAKANQNEVHFRPHFKTHQSAAVGEWFRERGVDAITVSSVDMAHYFAENGWSDITIAFPVNLRQMNDINRLAPAIRLNLLVESAETVAQLGRQLHHPVRVWMKIDVGAGRTGIRWDNGEGAMAVAQAIRRTPNLSLAGVLTHASQTYRASNKAEATAVYEEVTPRLQGVQRLLRQQGIDALISIGDTPGCSLVDSFAGVDEIRPGNFVFYDLMQWEIGACTEDEIAVAVACPVVAKHPDRRQLILYGGAVHFSAQFLYDENKRPLFGRLTHLTENGWSPVIPGANLVALSQEHGIAQVEQPFFDSVQVGDLVAVLPVHSCLTVDLLPYYLTLDGERLEKGQTK